MKATLDHVGIAVANIHEALAFYRDALGLDIDAPEEVASQRVRAYFIPLDAGASPVRGTGAQGGSVRGTGVQGGSVRGIGAPGASLELLEATAPDSPIARYVQQRGPGLHHITLRVDDIAAALTELQSRGVRLIDETPRPGAHGSLVAFIHPSSAHGVLVELTQAPAAAE